MGGGLSTDPRLGTRLDAFVRPDQVAAVLKGVAAHYVMQAEDRVAARSDHARFPRGWLFHHRWGRNAEARTARGERIRHITVGGRTTAWVPTVQR